jgi:hypothetical protein
VNCEAQPAGPGGRDHIGMQSHSMTEVEIDSFQAQQRPDADMQLPDSDNRTIAHGHGPDPRTHRALELGFQQLCGQACKKYRDNCSGPQSSSARSKQKHRRKDATLGSLTG